MNNRIEEEKADTLVAYLDEEAFQYYFENFTKDNYPTEETSSL